MELRHLRYFVALAEELHFGRAAARLHISQPPLSQQIAGLERELDARLFARTKRRVVLTDAGRLFLPEARATLEQAERARLVAARAQRGELGELRMGMFPSAPLSNTVSAAISAFRRSVPDVRLLLREMLTPQQVAELESGELDVGFLRSHIRPALPPGIAATEVVREPLCVMMPADHPLAAGAGPLPLAALEGEAIVFLARSVGSALNDQLHSLCAAAGFAPRITQETSANAMIVGLVAAGLGLSVQPATLCRIGSDRIRVRRLDAPGAVTASWLAHRDGDPSPLVRRFVGHFRQDTVHMEEPPPGV